ncbi:MAG: response regulator [Lentisphaerales bacterium]|nr:MAG: response regulator [Lentisphaerales bacterium]
MKPRVLIVDDNEENRYLLHTLLSAHGREVVSATNGAEALEKLRAGRFDMIIADVLMPIMDGFQLCRECKNDPGLKDILFVFLTATYTDDKDANLAVSLGADEYVRKPVEPDKFMAIVEEVFSRRRKKGRSPIPAVSSDENVSELYSKVLVEKLENKMLDLERAQKALQESAAELRRQKKALEEKNIALKEVLAQIETEKIRVQQQISANVGKSLLPLVRGLRHGASELQNRQIDVLELNLQTLTSNFGVKLSGGSVSLTQRQIEICNMIRGGMTSKEIAESLSISVRTVETQRNRIRRKLGIAGKAANLATYLETFGRDSS